MNMDNSTHAMTCYDGLVLDRLRQASEVLTIENRVVVPHGIDCALQDFRLCQTVLGLALE